MSDVTRYLHEVAKGDPNAANKLLSLVYRELRQLAASKMRRESAQLTLQPTALVHEAWLRLGADQQPAWQNRAHFFSAAAEAMRRILIDRARKRRAIRHGGPLVRVDADEVELVDELTRVEDQLLAVHEVLDKFAETEPQKAELVKLRYFVGLTLEQAADVLNIPFGTAKRWWSYTKASLQCELKAR